MSNEHYLSSDETNGHLFLGPLLSPPDTFNSGRPTRWTVKRVAGCGCGIPVGQWTTLGEQGQHRQTVTEPAGRVD